MFDRIYILRVAVVTFLLGITALTGYAQQFTKVFENNSYTDYELRNDSLAVVPSYELLIPNSTSGQAYRVLELRSTFKKANLANYQSEITVFGIPKQAPATEVIRPGIFRGKRVATLKIHVARINEAEDGFLITESARIRVFKNEAALSTAVDASPKLTNHPLSSGNWYKIPVRKTHIYQITRSYLENLGIDVDNIDPRDIQIWGTSGHELPQANSEPRESLTQIPILLSGESDGSFDSGDRILFYGKSTDKLTFDPVNTRFIPEINPYDNSNYYFLTIGSTAGLRLQDEIVQGTPSRNVNTFKDLIWKEEELFKSEAKIKSGRNWLGQRFNPDDRGEFISVLRDTLPGLINGAQNVPLFIRAVGRSTRSMSFDVRLNSTNAGSIFLSSIRDYNSEEGASGRSRDFDVTVQVNVSDEIIDLEFRMNHNESQSQGFLDWARMYVDRRFTAEDNRIRFFGPQDGSASELVTYRLNGFDSTPVVLDVTDPVNPRKLDVRTSGNEFLFDYTSDPNRVFIAQSAFPEPPEGSSIPNQNLHAISEVPDYIVVTSSELQDEANELASYRAQNDGLSTVVVIQDQVFNEFSGGRQDPTAIRDFVKMFYDRAITNGTEAPRYLLLFGNATFDYKDIDSGSQVNHVISYQSEQSLLRTASFGTDDYFGLLDDNEGEMPDFSDDSQRIDIGIGRIPANNTTEARIFLDKIRIYDSEQSPDAWKNTFTFSADDDFPEESNRDLHVVNSEGTLSRMDRDEAAIRFNRIYEFSYPVETTAAGRKIPQASQDFINSINNGTLVINYSGHGNEQVLSDEELFISESISQLTNLDRLTIFVTATCQFGRYDDQEEQSGAEKLIFHPEGGAIASLTTTRVVFTSVTISTSNNFGLNIQLSQNMIERDEEGRPRRLGDIMLDTKQGSGGGSVNTRKFILIGDPATRIRLPEHKIALTSLNDVNEFNPDSAVQIRALDRVKLEGQVTDSETGAVLSAFNGPVDINVFDGARFVKLPERPWVLEGNCDLNDCQYSVQNDVLFKGKAQAENGRFSAQFIVPRDISFSQNNGRFLFYAEGNNRSGGGAFNGVIFDGINPDAQNDGQGPDLDVYLNNKNFVNGNLVGNSPTLFVELSDQSGINTTGTGVGHEIIATIDTKPQTTFVLNDFYEANLNDFTGGRIEFPLDDIPEGAYTLTVRAWDVHNNPTEQEIFFEVAAQQQLSVRNVYNFPNPMHNKTQFTFEHNQQGIPLDVSVKIFTLSGRPVQHLKEQLITQSSYANIQWNGRDRDYDRLGNGTYIYVLRVAADTPQGRQVFEKIEKLVIIR